MTLLEKSISNIDENFLSKKLKDKTFFGYWRREESAKSEFPFPTEYIDFNWDVEEKQKIISTLKNAKVYESWMGWSNCRLCGIVNGSRCMIYNNLIFPEGLVHYIEKHFVKPPQNIIDIIL